MQFMDCRMVQMECNNSCGRGVHCSNKRIFRRECVDKLSLFETSNGRGLGVRTDVPLQKGQVSSCYTFPFLERLRMHFHPPLVVFTRCQY